MRKLLLVLASLIGSVVICFAETGRNIAEFNEGTIKEKEVEVSLKKQNGYKAFVELGYNVGIGEYSIDRFEVQTSHGFKFSPCFFVGAGIGLEHYHKLDITAIPVFCDIRANILETLVSPTIGLKIGYSFKDVKGFYMSPSVGCKMDAFIVSVGYVLQFVKTEFGDYLNEGVSFKIGYSF